MYIYVWLDSPFWLSQEAQIEGDVGDEVTKMKNFCSEKSNTDIGNDRFVYFAHLQFGRLGVGKFHKLCLKYLYQ